MKVNVYKTVDVECECDVSLDDCINEFFDIAEKDKEMPRRLLLAVDAATKILDRITPEMVKLSELTAAQAVIKIRLEKWIKAVQS